MPRASGTAAFCSPVGGAVLGSVAVTDLVREVVTRGRI